MFRFICTRVGLMSGNSFFTRSTRPFTGLFHPSIGPTAFHFSFDIDGVDCQVAPGVGTPVNGGLTYRESHLLCEMAHDSGKMIAMDLMEVSPVEDIRNATAELGVELILSAHGKKIL